MLRLPRHNEILVFGAKSVPPDILESPTYSPHIILLGEERGWGPVPIDIKPMYYAYTLDSLENPHLDTLAWIEEGITKMIVCLQDILSLTDKEEINEVLTLVENGFYEVMFPNQGMEI